MMGYVGCRRLSYSRLLPVSSVACRCDCEALCCKNQEVKQLETGNRLLSSLPLITFLNPTVEESKEKIKKECKSENVGMT
eukprot:scaffold713_cov68-Cyclotella_meneghiniana.AAC.9